MKTVALFFALIFRSAVLFAADGSRTNILDTKNATLEGPNARYDGGPDFHCIRDWKNTNIVARWNFDVPAKGAYRVLLTYACPTNLFGSEIEVTVGSQRAGGFTESTGTWITFKEFDLGPLLLRKPGTTEVAVKITRILNKSGAWDLRTVKLVREE